MTRPDDNAFPDTGYKGLTIREHFAAMAMHGYCSCPETCNQNDETIARMAVNTADALIAELNRISNEK